MKGTRKRYWGLLWPKIDPRRPVIMPSDTYCSQREGRKESSRTVEAPSGVGQRINGCIDDNRRQTGSVGWSSLTIRYLLCRERKQRMDCHFYWFKHTVR